MVINRKVLPWLIAGIALATILLIVLVMVTQAAPDSSPHRGPIPPNIPTIVSYQGQVNIAGIPYTGTGYFRFAIVNTGGEFYWSNDGTDAITPTEAVTLTVVNGLFNVLLGETNPITYGVFSDSDRWLRVWFDDGAHGVQLLDPDTRLTTAPFAFQADHATTAITATIFKTEVPNIVGDPYNGNPRGLGAVDMQLQRGLNFEVASGSYSVIGGGVNNQASGIGSTVLGGSFNSAWGNYCVASGFGAQSGLDANDFPRFYDGVFVFSDSTQDEFNGITDNEFAIRARGGFRHAYDGGNYWTAQVDNVGAVVLDSVGSNQSFTINDNLTVNGAFSATVLTATYATMALTATNALTATFATTATTALTATNAMTATFATTALTATNAMTATYATTALTATNAMTATYATTALTATNALTATFAMTATTALTATNATTATYATTALIASNLTQSPYARIYNNANISIASATWTTITFNSELWDTDAFHSTSSNTSRMVAPRTGLYFIDFHGKFATNATGIRSAQIRLNANGSATSGTNIVQSQVPTVATVKTTLSAVTMYLLTAGDYLEAFVYQDSTSTITFDYAANDSPSFMMVLMP